MRTWLIFCGVLLIVLSGFSNADEKCLTPSKKAGICIAIRSCSPFMSIVSNFTQLTQANRKLIQKSRCIPQSGTNVLNPVCCPQANAAKPDARRSRYTMPIPGVCGIEAIDKLLGGTATGITEFPWMALINYSKINGKKGKGKKKNFLCGGSLISKNYVLTAAHCVTGKITRSGWRPSSVRFGEHDLTTSPDYDSESDRVFKKNAADREVDFRVSEVIPHKGYVPFSLKPFNDIALIRLSRSVRFTDFIKPICLPFAPVLRTRNYDNEAVAVAGFGRTANGRFARSSDIKQKLEMIGFNWNQCNNTYQRKYHFAVGPNELCAGGEKGEDSCSGDSGGPLVAFDRISMPGMPYRYLVGIVSRGLDECGTKGAPGIYTRVDKYLDWIMQKVKK